MDTCANDERERPIRIPVDFSSSVNPNADLILTFFAFGVTSLAVFGLEASLLVARICFSLYSRIFLVNRANFPFAIISSIGSWSW